MVSTYSVYSDSLINSKSDSAEINDNAKAVKNSVPAIEVKLTGQYLIEASAGTGKTWTLTGIVLRLLIEAKRAPEQIIATTFTRAAAAEMRERIHARLVDFHQLLLWVNKIPITDQTRAILYPQLLAANETNQCKNNANKSNPANQTEQSATKKISAKQRQLRNDWLEQQAQLAGMDEILLDPINQHLVIYLLDHTEDYSLIEATRRCALVLTTLDKLFVGTLDSLSQKWLSEYSAETGHQQGMQISDSEQLVIDSIIHDAIRAHHSHLYHQQPKVYELLQHTKRLSSPKDHLEVAQKSLQFISTMIEPVELGEAIDFAKYECTLAEFINCDLAEVDPYFDMEYCLELGFRKGSTVVKNILAITDIHKSISDYGHVFYANLTAEAETFYNAIANAFISQDDGGNIFKKGFEENRLTFTQIKAVQLLKSLVDYSQQIESHLDALVDNLNREIALNVRKKLPTILESRNETTFALQMVRLNQALTGKQGARLARYIRHHYPIALIDESQDINGEQATMIERIYLAKSTAQNTEDNTKASRGFLLLVGDPKQAIYGFRGGDVANYNAMKARFDKKRQLSLNVNRRSNERLIEALNHWFGSSNQSSNDAVKADNNALSNLGKDIHYQHITADKKGFRLSWQQNISTQEPSESYSTVAQTSPIFSELLTNSPVSIIHRPNNKELANNYSSNELTALHIAALLDSQQTIDGRAIQPSDIGVLARTKADLKEVEKMLAKLEVPTLETAENNVFHTIMATDLVALLELMLRPHRRDIMNRVLTSQLYQFSLSNVQKLMQSVNDDSSSSTHFSALTNAKKQNQQRKREQDKLRFQNFQNYIKTAASYWEHYGILSALQYLFGRNPLNGLEQQSLWVNIADLKDGARHLMDMRHLLDILAQFGMHIGEYELLAWYKKQMSSSHTPEWARQQPLPTESGVQLMTIHKSKGLEFPIVYVIGMDGASKEVGKGKKHNLFLYDHTNNRDEPSLTERRLSSAKAKLSSQSAKGGEVTFDYAQFETEEGYQERKRLGYVAFTRASEQLYIVLSDASTSRDSERKPSLHWLSAETYKHELPERLQPFIGWLAASTIEEGSQAILNRDRNKLHKQLLNDAVEKSDLPELIDYDEAYEQLRRNYFQGWAKTSFTALSRQLSEQSQALAIFDDSIEDDFDLTDNFIANRANQNTDTDSNAEQQLAIQQSTITADDIRFRFVKGANAGTFLHQVFEQIDFDDKRHWSTVIDQSLRQFQLPMTYSSLENQQRLIKNTRSNHAVSQVETSDESLLLAEDHLSLLTWINDVLEAPLLASNQSLRQIPADKRFAELGFNMGLAESFVPEDLNEIFKQYLPDDPDKHLQLNAESSEHIYRYLRGEIDLVYEYAGKYYVVDYKSNYLGNSLSSYDTDNLNAAMNKAGYWLQAAIYQLALHRFLRLRLSNYQGNEQSYLGAVEYVFLRGIDSKGLHRHGLVKWDIPFALVAALDEKLGIPTA